MAQASRLKVIAPVGIEEMAAEPNAAHATPAVFTPATGLLVTVGMRGTFEVSPL